VYINTNYFNNNYYNYTTAVHERTLQSSNYNNNQSFHSIGYGRARIRTNRRPSI